jgi:hypothetical protein
MLMNAYTRLKFHVDRYKYTKGSFTGDAPLDKNRRSRSHARVQIISPTRAGVIFHNTRILTADSVRGTVTLDSGGWEESPTTREALRGAIRVATEYNVWVSTHASNGYKQTTITTPHGAYVFYDGMEFDDGMRLTSPAKPFMTYRADIEARKAVAARYAEFRSVLPVLVAGIQRRTHWLPGWQQLSNVLDDPGRWPDVVAYYYAPDPKVVWRRVYNVLTEHMRVVVPE